METCLYILQDACEAQKVAEVRDLMDEEAKLNHFLLHLDV